MPAPSYRLTRRQRFVKRAFDLAIAIPGLILAFPIILAAVIAASFDTREWGLFSQQRVGRWGRPFAVRKIRSMRTSSVNRTTVTTKYDARITRFGSVLRRFKVDELPQLWNVVVGDMSLVGPRPDVPGWADRLEGSELLILSVRPGITGPATIAFRNEEEILSLVDDPETFNSDVLWPAKCRMNMDYIATWRLIDDVNILMRTVIGRATPS